MGRLCRALSDIEDPLFALERRGVSLKAHAERRDPATRALPVFHVFVGGVDRWFTQRSEVDAFLAEQEAAAGHELPVDGDDGEESTPTAPRIHIVELHEVRAINKQLAALAECGFEIDALLPQERTGSDDDRYVLRRGESEIGLEDLRGLLPAVRTAGEKGLQVTRFKGLGEMNPEELRITTLHPDNRTMMRVTMEDAGSADELFRVLMGDKVEPRREFIEDHALEVKNLDV